MLITEELSSVLSLIDKLNKQTNLRLRNFNGMTRSWHKQGLETRLLSIYKQLENREYVFITVLVPALCTYLGP